MHLISLRVHCEKSNMEYITCATYRNVIRSVLKYEQAFLQGVTPIFLRSIYGLCTQKRTVFLHPTGNNPCRGFRKI